MSKVLADSTGAFAATPAAAARAGLPLESAPLARPLDIIVFAWAIRLSALFNFVAVVRRHEPKFIYWLGHWVPFEISEGRRVLMLLTSVLLLLLASGLVRGKRTAWFLTIGALTIAPLLHLGRAVIWPQALINLAFIGFLILRRNYFVARSDQRSVRTAFLFCPVFFAALLMFGTIRLHALHKHSVGDHSWLGCFQTACELVFVQNSHTQHAQTLRMLHFFSILRITGASIALIGLFLVLRPVVLRRQASAAQREKVRHLLEEHGNDPFDPYALLEDKSYFFTSDGRGVIPYALSGNVAVALGNPIAPASGRLSAITEFAHFCRREDWEPVFYQTTPDSLPSFHAAGFASFKIGEEALLRGDEFRLAGGNFQNLRTACNKARKAGIQFRWYEGTEKPDPVLERQLAGVSECWLEKKEAGEMTFDMGSFSVADIRAFGAGVAIDPAGRPLAFATWRPFAQGTGRSLDIMRSRPEARNVMDFLLVESIFHFRDRGVRDISLGTAPLANAEPGEKRLPAEEMAVRFSFENMNRIYGYKSLFEFKRKYRPRWQGRYLAYRQGASLPLVALAVIRVHAPAGLLKFLTG